LAYRATDQVRAGDQSQDREGAMPRYLNAPPALVASTHPL